MIQLGDKKKAKNTNVQIAIQQEQSEKDSKDKAKADSPVQNLKLTELRPRLSRYETTNADAFCHPSPLAPANF